MFFTPKTVFSSSKSENKQKSGNKKIVSTDTVTQATDNVTVPLQVPEPTSYRKTTKQTDRDNGRGSVPKPDAVESSLNPYLYNESTSGSLLVTHLTGRSPCFCYS